MGREREFGQLDGLSYGKNGPEKGLKMGGAGGAHLSRGMDEACSVGDDGNIAALYIGQHTRNNRLTEEPVIV